MIYNHTNTLTVPASDEDQLYVTEASFHYSSLTSASPRSFMVPLLSVTLIDTGLMISAVKPRWLLFTRITASIPSSLYWLHSHRVSSHTHLNVSDLPLCTELNNATSMWMVACRFVAGDVLKGATWGLWCPLTTEWTASNLISFHPRPWMKLLCKCSLTPDAMPLPANSCLPKVHRAAVQESPGDSVREIKAAYIRIVNVGRCSRQQPYIKISFRKCQNIIDKLTAGERRRWVDQRQMGHQDTEPRSSCIW